MKQFSIGIDTKRETEETKQVKNAFIKEHTAAAIVITNNNYNTSQNHQHQNTWSAHNMSLTDSYFWWENASHVHPKSYWSLCVCLYVCVCIGARCWLTFSRYNRVFWKCIGTTGMFALSLVSMFVTATAFTLFVKYQNDALPTRSQQSNILQIGSCRLYMCLPINAPTCGRTGYKQSHNFCA